MSNELIALGGAFLAAGLLGRLGKRFGLPTIPLFIAAGMLTGPHTPGLVLFAEPEDLELFASAGLVLLLFYLGLEFSLHELVGGGKPLLFAGIRDIAFNVGGGLLFGLILGWGTEEAFIVAGAMGISSSAIVTKLLVELRRLANPETRLILGIIVVEDLFIALYLALMQPVLGGTEGVAESLLAFLKAFGFLSALALIARFGAHWVGRLVTSRDEELLTVLFVGLAVLAAGIAEEVGVSSAIGAFMVGLILAETQLKPRIETLVLPLRDAFAAVFFFAFGLTIDPSDIPAVAGAAVVAASLTVLLNLVAGLLNARSWRFGRRAAANVALTIVGRGEFSLILATLAAGAGMDARLGPFVALYVLVLAIAGPLLATHSSTLARLLPRELFPSRPPRRAPAFSQVSRPFAERSLGPTKRSSDAVQRPSTLRNAFVRRFRMNSQMPLGRLFVPAACLAGVFVYGATGYLVLGYSLAEAVSMLWSDFNPAGTLRATRPDAARFFGLTVTALGLVSLLIALATVTGIAVEGGFRLSWRGRRMKQRIDRLEGHYIICAYGRVGRAVAREFEAEGVPFVVLDTKEELEERMQSDGVLYLIGDPSSEAVLRQAGIERAEGLVCAVDSDAANVYITLTARALNPEIFITARAGEPESPERLYRAGANRVISPYVTSGRHMALLTLRPRVVDYLELAGARGLRLEEVVIEAGSPLVGLELAEVAGEAVPVLLRRGSGETIPNPSSIETLQTGDILLLYGEPKSLRPLEGGSASSR